jgi:arginase
LGIPFDYGQIHIGVRLAYEALIERGLLNRLSEFAGIENCGEMKIPFKTPEEKWKKIKHIEKCAIINYEISKQIEHMDLSSSFLLNVGGDHGMALGTVHAMLMKEPETVVVWADAHGDINLPESSPSGNFHGMPLAFILGLASDDNFSWVFRHLIPKNLIFFGPRDLDPWEKDIIKSLGIQYFSSEEINRIGSQKVVEMALYRADPRGVKPIHLSFDVDLFDAYDIKATGTRVNSGPRLEEVFLMGGLLAQTGRLRSMDLVEFNPLLGTEEEVEASADIILKFVETTIGQVFNHHRIITPIKSYNLFGCEDVV